MRLSGQPRQLRMPRTSPNSSTAAPTYYVDVSPEGDPIRPAQAADADAVRRARADA